MLAGWRRPGLGGAARRRGADDCVALAREFVERTRGDETVWHVDELAEPLGPAPTAVVDRRRPLRRGRWARSVTHAVVAVPLGLLRRDHVDALARVTDRVRVTPWRSLVVEDGAAALPELEAAGLATHAGRRGTACTPAPGLPGCARSALDTRALARALAPVLPPGRLPVHVSGCERRCGTPATAYVDLLAPPSLDARSRSIRARAAPTPSSAHFPTGRKWALDGERGRTAHSTGRSETAWT